jgi:3-dehydroquinate synthase
VGGKVGINLSAAKNMVGAFLQPLGVLIDTATLDTLAEREYRAGLGEVVKYGVISEADFFVWLEENAEGLRAQSPDALSHAVAVSCQAKADVVADDERESGRRAILNFGHTFGHAIEALTGYQQYLHGEAVAIGMVQAADLSARLGLLSWDDARRVRALLARFDLPVVPPELDARAMLDAMGMDKKVVDGTLRLILARKLGEAFVSSDVPQDALMATLTAGEALCDG